MDIVYATLVEQVLHVPQREGGEADLHHHSEPNDFERSFEILEWVAHPRRLHPSNQRIALSAAASTLMRTPRSPDPRNTGVFLRQTSTAWIS